MAVDDEADAKEAIEERCGRAGGREGRAGERDEACGEKTLESPVVRPVRLVCRRESRRFVHGALVDRYSEHPCHHPSSSSSSSSIRKRGRTATGNIGKVSCRTTCCLLCGRENVSKRCVNSWNQPIVRYLW